MFDIKKKEVMWGGRKLIMETGKMARQADGAALVSYGDTVVLACATYDRKPAQNLGFFPLSVHYIEKFYAAGKIPGGYLKRESKPSDHEALVSRLIDRPLRPLFDSRFCNETQIICTVMSLDKEIQSDIVAMIAAFLAAKLAGLPIEGTMAGARVGLIDGKYVLNPSVSEMKNSAMDLVVAGTTEGILMVESEIDQIEKEDVLKAVAFGHENLKPVIEAIEEMSTGVNKVKLEAVPAHIKTLRKTMENKFSVTIKKSYGVVDKKERSIAVKELRSQAVKEMLVDEKLVSEFESADSLERAVSNIFHDLEHDIVRAELVKKKTRIDGRKFDEIRNIDCQIGVLPRVHGSALFTRGETQALVTTTLGTANDEKMEDDLLSPPGIPWKHKFMLHYNFPAYSVGEVGRLGPVGRREIGHGKLAWRAINPVLNLGNEYPYTIRVVSEILESNGSSSMATVCGTSMALMDAGVDIKAVAGIAMGLIKEKDTCIVLSDIMGDEDHLGDMDFKVAGTEDGITSLQMDIKITGISMATMEEALGQAFKGIEHILDCMNGAIARAKDTVSEYAPQIETIKIKTDKIRELIGPGGSVIKQISRDSNASIDITEKDSKVSFVNIAAFSKEDMNKAKELVGAIVLEPELGKSYVGEVVNIKEFGAFIRIMGGKDALLHISEVSKERVERVEDYLSLGQKIVIEIVDFDKNGRPKLRYVGVDQSKAKA